MLAVSAPVINYAASAPPPAAEAVRRDAAQVPVIPDPGPASAGATARRAADPFESAVRGVDANRTVDSRAARKPGEDNAVPRTREEGEAGSDAPVELTAREGREDNGSTDDSRGEGRERARDLQLSQAEEALLRQLRSADRNVRAHEAAHAAVGGQYAGAPSFDYRQGPDGQRYAVAGEVPIDIAPVSGDPQATIRKMSQVAQAALAPVDPSAQDRRVAARAQAAIAAARAVMAAELGDEPVRVSRVRVDDTGGVETRGKAGSEAVAGDAASLTRASRANDGGLTVFPDAELRAPCPLCSKPHLAPPDVSVRLMRSFDVGARLQDLGISERELPAFRASA